MLTRREIEERLGAIPPLDEGQPDEAPEWGMAATRCACGRWMQIVRPGKVQCACEIPIVRAADELREALETAKQLAEWLVSVTAKADGCSCPISDDSWQCADCRDAIAKAEAWLEGWDE